MPVNPTDRSNHSPDIAAIMGGVAIAPLPPRHPTAAATIPGIATVPAAAEKALLRGAQNGFARLVALRVADAATDMLLFWVAHHVVSGARISETDIQAVADAADAWEHVADVAVADKDNGLAEQWYALAARLNHDGFRALSLAAHR